MFLFFLFVASQITGALACSCGRELFQETYCRNNYVIRARKIRDGTIRGQPKPLVNQFSLVFEVKVNHIYKQPYGSNITKVRDVFGGEKGQIIPSLSSSTTTLRAKCCFRSRYFGGFDLKSPPIIHNFAARYDVHGDV